MPSVSIILPTHNRPELFKTALASINLQSFRDMEVVVVNDNGCPIRDIINEWDSILRIKYLELDRSHGLPAARNRALEIAEGDYIAFLDDDDIFLPEHLFDGIRFLKETNADIVYADSHVSSIYLGEHALPRRGPFDFDFDFDPSFLLVANYIPIISVITKNFKKFGIKFDSTLSACEDWDLFLYLYYRAGFRFEHLNKVTSVYHRVQTEASITGQAYRDASSLHSLVNGYNRVAEKWKNHCGEKEHKFRGYLDEFHSLREQTLHSPTVLPHNSYEILLHFLQPKYRGNLDLNPPPQTLKSLFVDVARGNV